MSQIYITGVTEYRQNKDKVAFVSHILPRIKSGMLQIFLHLIFPSTLEVTSSCNQCALVSFGLTHMSSLASLVFKHVFNSLSGTASKPINLGVFDSSTNTTLSTTLSANGHEFDSKQECELLWFDFGVGLYAIKTFNSVYNTYINLIHEVVSKFFKIPFMPYLFLVI